MSVRIQVLLLCLLLAGGIVFFVINPLLFKYIIAMVGGSIQVGHL